MEPYRCAHCQQPVTGRVMANGRARLTICRECGPESFLCRPGCIHWTDTRKRLYVASEMPWFGLLPKGAFELKEEGMTTETVTETVPVAQATAEMVEVALDRIIPNPWQPRLSNDPEHIENLMKDIEAVGLLQEPMARKSDNYYQLAFGHCRVEALRGLQEQEKWGSTVKVKVAPLTDQQMAYIALSENSARKDVTPIEQITAWAKALREIPDVTIQGLADKVGIDRGVMSRYLTILELPKPVLELVDSGEMSLRAARELLVLRNDHHCHEDQILMVLQDCSGKSTSAYYESNKPPDYRIKTIRKAIRGLAQGKSAYGDVKGIYENDRKWRPLDNGSNRAVRFDVAEFKKEFPHSVHVLPEGEESGGMEWTCEVKAWARYSSRATREYNQAAESSSAGGGGTFADSARAPQSNPRQGQRDQEWVRLLKRDPVVKEQLGKRLRSVQSLSDFTDEDREALGTRIKPVNENSAIRLPPVAQPEATRPKQEYHADQPPMFDFSQCATCIQGAGWIDYQYSGHGPVLACTNRQLYDEKKQVGMALWTAWKERQIDLDYHADLAAINRLAVLQPGDAKGIFNALVSFAAQAKAIEPLDRRVSGLDYDERKLHDYYPAGAWEFAALAFLALPASPSSMKDVETWRRGFNDWLEQIPEDFDWPRAAACIQVWFSRHVLGLGADLWPAVSTDTATPDSGGETRTSQRRGRLCASCKELALPNESRCADCKAKRQAKARAEREARTAQVA